ncbi:MAG: hypothetical protein ACLFVN_02775 [Phycisphaeraceae bacterium]
MRIHQTLLLPALALLVTLTAVAAPAQTTVEITDDVLREKTYRIGVHYSGGNYHDSPIEKRPLEMNFEGTLYRLVLSIDALEGNTAFTTTLAPDDDRRENPFLDIIEGSTYHVLSGPDQWKSGKVREVVQDEIVNPNNKNKERRPGLVLDEPFKMLPRTGWHSNGLLVDILRNEGNAGRLLVFNWQPDQPMGDYKGYDYSEHAELVQGDTADETFGDTALLLPGSKGKETFTAQLQWVPPYPPNWEIGVWAKARSGQPTLSVSIPGLGSQSVQLTREWQHHKMRFSGQAKDRMSVEFAIDGGDALIDDATADILGDKNPTVFRDVLVDILKQHRPGVIRLLHNTGGSAENIIKPALQAYATSGSTYGSFYHRKPGHHEFFQLADEVDANAWANLPGTMLPEDIEFYLEWIAGPTDTPGGALRAKLGREKPWTDTIEEVYVEIGNETITFGGNGYSGPDYWKNLIATGKKSPWYDPEHIKFMVDQQPSLSQNFEKTPNADLLNVHNYNVNPSMFADEVDRYLDTDEKLAKYILASPYYLWTEDPGFAPDSEWGAVQFARTHDKELVSYEGGNYHTTHGDASPKLRNKFLTGAVGGLSMANNMLWIHKNMEVTAQNQFNLFGFSFAGHGAFGDGTEVRLWGQVLNPLDEQKRRYRPAFLGTELANRLIYGKLVKTAHQGDDPTFSSTGLFKSKARNEKQYEKIKDDAVTIDVPMLYSYAFDDGDRHSLILVSYDLEKTRKIKVDLPDGQQVHGGFARTWTLAADSMWANNEPESPRPGVRIEPGRIDGFADGVEVDVPPYTMIGLEWYETAEAADSAEPR